MHVYRFYMTLKAGGLRLLSFAQYQRCAKQQTSGPCRTTTTTRVICTMKPQHMHTLNAINIALLQSAECAKQGAHIQLLLLLRL